MIDARGVPRHDLRKGVALVFRVALDTSRSGVNFSKDGAMGVKNIVRLVVAGGLLAGFGGAAWAEGPASAVEFAPDPEGYGADRLGWRVNATASEAAVSYVRGCDGFVMAEAAGLGMDLLNPRETLYFIADGADLASVVLGTPDGLYRCIRAEDGTAMVEISGDATGRYSLWPAVSTEGGQIVARVIASDALITQLEVRGLDVSLLDAPRMGRFQFDAETAEAQLIGTGPIFAQTAADFLTPGYCAGLIGLDAPDATIAVDASAGRFSLYATTPGDGVIVIYTPSGGWVCNDDMSGLNPGVTFEAAEAGDYLVWVGALYEGGADTFELFARLGDPDWGLPPTNIDGDPRYGFSELNVDQATSGQLLIRGEISATAAADTLPNDMYCSGYINADAPDLVLTLDRSSAAFSLFATSDVDLVMAVRSPLGEWLCNDDTMGTDPAVTFDAGDVGEYLIYVGAFSEGAVGRFDLFARMGEPDWTMITSMADNGFVPDTGFAVELGLDQPPSHGTVIFPQDGDAHIPMFIAAGGNDYFGLGFGCVGRGATAQPDLVIEVTDAADMLTIFAVADGDGTLVVVDPYGDLYCNDDFEGAHPALSFPEPELGLYQVFAGTYGGEASAAILGVTSGAPDWTLTPAQ